MAARVNSHAPVGGPDWILKEYKDISSICDSELEDFTFSARNEAEWLNEHMAELLSSNSINLAEILKTPGKLRGKTPRTVRQRSPLKEVRQPLAEIAPIDKRFNSPINQRPEIIAPKLQLRDAKIFTAPVIEPGKVNRQTKDSGYHDDSDSMDLDRELPATQDLEDGEKQEGRGELAGRVTDSQDGQIEGRSTEGSFQSAKEDQTCKEGSERMDLDDIETDNIDTEAERASEQLRRESAISGHIQVHVDDATAQAQDSAEAQDEDMADASSENSTPAKTLTRKSSLTFATLPAREPLATKKSMGNRNSGQAGNLSRSSYFGRITSGRSLGAALFPEDGDDDVDVEDEDAEEDQENRQPTLIREESDGTRTMVKMHSKSSTQRLHDRISALSKNQTTRPTKSIPSALLNAQAEHAAPGDVSGKGDIHGEALQSATVVREGSDAWIPRTIEGKQTLQPAPEEERLVSAYESGQATTAQRHQEEPEPAQRPSTTPVQSPPKHLLQPGPINASKSKIQSLMQSARGLFSSSAATSAQAKLEAASATSPSRDEAQPTYPNLPNGLGEAIAQPAEPRRTRSSTEKAEREEKQKRGQQEQSASGQRATTEDRLQADSESTLGQRMFDKQQVRKEARQPVSDEQDELAEYGPERPQTAMGPPAKPRTMLQKPSASKRPISKPTKQQPPQAKVSIKIGSMAGRRPLTAATLSSATKGSEMGSQQKSGAVGKKESTASHSTTASSAMSFKSSTVSSVVKPKALLAAERKKEADEKAAQKKLEQRRELERRKAAQQDEARKREQDRQAAERQKERDRLAEEERKRQEQRQAVERARADQTAKREQMQKDIEQRQAMKNSTMRHDPGTVRPPSRQAAAQDFPRPPSAQPQTGTGKGPKRVWNPDHEDELSRPARAQPTQNYQQTQESKRRKTDEDEIVEQAQKRPVMAPPVRISNILKHGPKASMFGSNYPRAPPPANHHASTVQNGAQQGSHHHQQSSSQVPPSRPGTAMDNARFQNGAIPFANSNHGHGGGPGVVPQSAFKTPLQASKFGQPQPQQSQPQQPKSSPFINGEYLHLDEIATDSEDEDSEDERERKANMPDWVLTPNLQQTLKDQEGRNPDAVFGPIAPLNMEEMFKDRKGQARFRSRTSSANWFGADRLTEEEKVHDLEARERIRREGGWSFDMEG